MQNTILLDSMWEVVNLVAWQGTLQCKEIMEYLLRIKEITHNSSSAWIREILLFTKMFNLNFGLESLNFAGSLENKITQVSSIKRLKKGFSFSICRTKNKIIWSSDEKLFDLKIILVPTVHNFVKIQ